VKRALIFYGGLLLAVAAMAGVFYGLTTQSAYETSGLTRYKPEGQYLDAGGGRRLRVWCLGTGKPEVLLEASGLGGADQWKDVLPSLARYTRVCAYDRAGMGYSDVLGRAPTFKDYGDDLDKVAEKAGEGPFILVGASYGGLLMQAWARAHPEKTGALVLLDAVTPEAFALLDAPWSKLDRSMMLAGLAAKLGLLKSDDPLKLGVETQEGWLVYRAHIWSTTRQLLDSRHEAKALFEKLPPLPEDLPLRVLRHTRVGDLLGPDFSLEEHQKLEPEWVKLQEKAAAQSSAGKLVAAEKSGHLVAVDAPDLVKDTVVELMPRATERRLKLQGIVPHHPGAPAPHGPADAGQ
jgi:pimeloyl-ACP methyl ester carboxylesterase